MYIFWIPCILSFLLASLFFTENKSASCFVDFAKGYLALRLAGIFSHSGLSYLFATAGLLLGQSRPIFRGFKGGSAEVLSLGILTFMSPILGIILLFFFLLLKFLFRDYEDAVFATSFLIPILALKFFKSDAYILMSFFTFGVLIVQFLPPALEKYIKPRFLTRVAFAFLLFFACALFFFNKYVYKGFGVQKDLIRHGPGHFKYVAITFDDGPDPLYTPQILDILKEKDVRATFFLIGKNAQQYPEIAKRITKEGHTIGNHTYSHKSLIPLSAAATRKEIKRGEEAIFKATGIRPTLFRPPRGVYSTYALKFLRQERYTVVLWDVSAMDWAELPPQSIVSNVLRHVRPGSIILFHDSGDIVSFKGGDRTNTVKALPLVIDELKAQGYDFVTVDEMIFLSELMRTEDNGEDSDSQNPAH
ncbi:polysaccharide deacetylase family sporulation protein PdaB [Caldanaerovirga acetigignens]|jgi:polysaccharide deacetylase family sporulation protein PdaB|uniref:Polysaccharide deacetylase family sporulation protein PdaB n=1 Tax=Caldanaerovirga acetigignens TaxID=447595 RepID=A0A1M7KQM8_9FIRM|nr:polysaccharide deacetylase family sporulation protein PdaB [Caldanaerovirga acetigignens]